MPVDAIYLKNNPAEFHPDLNWNDRALGSFWRMSPEQEQQQEEQDEWCYGISWWYKNYYMLVMYFSRKL